MQTIPDICHFFTQAKFLEKKIYTEKTRKLRQNTQQIANFLRYYGKIHSKLPIFGVITTKYTVNCQIFALNLKKFTPTKKNLHEYIRGVRDKYEV